MPPEQKRAVQPKIFSICRVWLALCPKQRFYKTSFFLQAKTVSIPGRRSSINSTSTPKWHEIVWLYMKLYACMILENAVIMRVYGLIWKYIDIWKMVGLQRYLISSIKPSFFECSHDVNLYIISIAYSPCACKEILWFTWESFLKSVADKITISRPCSRKRKKIMLLQDELFL